MYSQDYTAISDSYVLPKREIIIVVDNDDEDIVATSILIDGMPAKKSKKELKESKEFPIQRQIVKESVQRLEYVDLCKENLDNKIEGKKGDTRKIPNKKRGHDFSKSEQRTMNARNGGALAERGEINEDGRAAALAVHDAPPQPPSLVRLSPNSNEYKEVSIPCAQICKLPLVYPGIRHHASPAAHSMHAILTKRRCTASSDAAHAKVSTSCNYNNSNMIIIILNGPLADR